MTDRAESFTGKPSERSGQVTEIRSISAPTRILYADEYSGYPPWIDAMIFGLGIFSLLLILLYLSVIRRIKEG